MAQCHKCGGQTGLHHSILPGCVCTTQTAAFSAPVQSGRQLLKAHGIVFIGDATWLVAQLVAAAEREACAKVCEQYDDDGGAGETWGPRFADAIRARGTP